jgi:hypothetical protein
MVQPLFIATERFDPSDGEVWRKYFEWAKIPALAEVAGLDGSLCHPVIGELLDEDWKHIADVKTGRIYFCHLDYLLNRVSDKPRRNILGVYHNPEFHILEAPNGRDFKFIGYDLIDDETQISALTNCGGFPDVFGKDELNSCGLLSRFEGANEVKKLLAEKYPEEPHAQCDMYAIWRLNEHAQATH